MTSGPIAPPIFANVFMHAVTVPAESRPTSRHIAQAALMQRSAAPAASAIRSAAAKGWFVTAAPASRSPLDGRAIAPTAHRPILSPYFFTQRSVQNPPSKLVIAPMNKTKPASKPADAAENARASRRYVGSHVR